LQIFDITEIMNLSGTQSEEVNHLVLLRNEERGVVC